jgi:pyruvate/2-oxoglutarate dehydrogenase complex dihydrolipoamide dehydrogenase (E3) component
VGRRTVVVERALIGGSCPNIACLPSKDEIRSAKVTDLVRHARAYRLRTEPLNTDIKGLRQRKQDMLDGVVEIYRKRLAVNGLKFLHGDTQPPVAKLSAPTGEPQGRAVPLP